MPPIFEEQKVEGAGKPDKIGRVAIRIFLIHEPAFARGDLTAATGNRREDIVLTNTTVGEVTKAIRQQLFGED